jgi:hypothetical protein
MGGQVGVEVAGMVGEKEYNDFNPGQVVAPSNSGIPRENGDGKG